MKTKIFLYGVAILASAYIGFMNVIAAYAQEAPFYIATVPVSSFKVSTVPPLPVPLSPFFPALTPTATAIPPTATPSITPSFTPCVFGTFFCKSELRYVSMGDSLAVGLFAVQGYTQRYEKGIEAYTGSEVQRISFAQNGWTSADLLHALQSNSALREHIAKADIVTWNIGGNDLRDARNKYANGQCGGVDNQECLRQTVMQFRDNWRGIVNEVQKVTVRRNVVVRTMDIYYPFVEEDMQSGAFNVLHPYWQAVNTYIQQGSRVTHIPYAAVSNRFNGASGKIDPSQQGYMSFDGYHPNDLGHSVIAQSLQVLGYAELPSKKRNPVVPTPRPSPPVVPIPRPSPPIDDCPVWLLHTFQCKDNPMPPMPTPIVVPL